MNETLLICTVRFKTASWQVEDNNIDEQLNDNCINNILFISFSNLFFFLNHSNNPKKFVIEFDRGMEMAAKYLKGDLYRRDS